MDPAPAEAPRSKIENLLQVAAALEPQKTVTRAAVSFGGQDVDQIRRLRRKLLSREYSRRYRMRIREKIGMIKSPNAVKSEMPEGDADTTATFDARAFQMDGELDSADFKALILEKSACSDVQDVWEQFVQSVQELSLTSDGRRAVITLARTFKS